MRLRQSGRAVIMLAGGIDSSTLMVELVENGVDLTAITFDYGQTLSREIELARANCDRYSVQHRIVSIPFAAMGKSCSVLGGQPIATDRNFSEIDQATPTSYVPFRNGVFLAWCIAFGEANGIRNIYGGCNGLLSGIYPDDTLEFAQAMTAAGCVGTSADYVPQILAPYASIKKSEIVRRGLDLRFDYSRTYSCYVGAERHCGRCDSCRQRLRAFSPHNLGIEGGPDDR